MLHRETKTDGGVKKKKRNECLKAFLSSRCLFDCEVKRGSGGSSWLADPQASEDRFAINLAQAEGEQQRMTFYHLRNLKQSVTVVEVA